MALDHSDSCNLNQLALKGLSLTNYLKFFLNNNNNNIHTAAAVLS